MLLSLLINLYCSRVVLRTLGVEDYGVYDVVGGVVVLFTFFTGPLSTSTSRFLTYEIGTQNKIRLNQVLTASIMIHLAFALMVCLLTETIGLWFVSNVLVIPPERLSAAFWVLHFSVISIFFLCCRPLSGQMSLPMKGWTPFLCQTRAVNVVQVKPVLAIRSLTTFPLRDIVVKQDLVGRIAKH